MPYGRRIVCLSLEQAEDRKRRLQSVELHLIIKVKLHETFNYIKMTMWGHKFIEVTALLDNGIAGVIALNEDISLGTKGSSRGTNRGKLSQQDISGKDSWVGTRQKS